MGVGEDPHQHHASFLRTRNLPGRHRNHLGPQPGRSQDRYAAWAYRDTGNGAGVTCGRAGPGGRQALQRGLAEVFAAMGDAGRTPARRPVVGSGGRSSPGGPRPQSTVSTSGPWPSRTRWANP
jgi:hypothetical protein